MAGALAGFERVILLSGRAEPVVFYL